eukprot:scaffold64864_cov64-Phaeocystis_antarctica.AAC.5
MLRPRRRCNMIREVTLWCRRCRLPKVPSAESAVWSHPASPLQGAWSRGGVWWCAASPSPPSPPRRSTRATCSESSVIRSACE